MDRISIACHTGPFVLFFQGCAAVDANTVTAGGAASGGKSSGGAKSGSAVVLASSVLSDNGSGPSEQASRADPPGPQRHVTTLLFVAVVVAAVT